MLRNRRIKVKETGMNHFMSAIENRIGPVAEKLSENRYLKAVNAGFMSSMPLVIVGSFFLLLCNIPINGYSQFMGSVFGEHWSSYLLKVFHATMDCITLFVIVGCSSGLAKQYKLDQVSATGISLASFLILTVFSEGTLAVSDLGAGALFMGLFVSILSVEITRLVRAKNWVIKLPASVPENIANSFSALIPALVVFLVFNGVRIVFELTSYGSFGSFVFAIVQYPLMKLGSSIWAIVIFIFAEMLMWSFGIHGSSVVGAVTTAFLTALTAENAAAVAAGQLPSNIINTQFLANFVRLGGAGATLGLVILMFFAKSKQYRSLGRLAIGPIAFQINEPVIFGFPLVLNPMMMIPFIVGPILIAITCYIAFSVGLVPVINGANIPWTTPPLVSGWLLCGFRGFLLQLFCLGETMIVWYPFFKISDNKAVELEREGEPEE